MNDCRGKNLALFYHLRQHRCGCFLLLFCYFFHSEESPEVSSIVLFLDMTPVGRAPQTKHWAAPALTHGESRGWLQWIKSWTPLPLPKTTRRYHNKTVLKMKKKISIQHFFSCRNFSFMTLSEKETRLCLSSQTLLSWLGLGSAGLNGFTLFFVFIHFVFVCWDSS